MSSQDLDQNNDSTCKTNVKDCDRSQKLIDEIDLDDDKNKNEKKYQDLVKSINYLKKFDWFDTNNPQLKTPPIKLLTPAAFWFMVCAEYFPRSLTIGTADPAQTLTELLQKIERQQIFQVIRVKDKSYQNLKGEPTDEQCQEYIQKIKQAIKKLKYDKPQSNIRNSAELKEDYTFEDDLYIQSVRNDLLDLYSFYIHQEFQQTNQQSCSSSESTTVEEDSRHLYITKDEINTNASCNEKQNTENAVMVVKEIDENNISEESQIKSKNEEPSQSQQDEIEEREKKCDLEQNNEDILNAKIEANNSNEEEKLDEEETKITNNEEDILIRKKDDKKNKTLAERLDLQKPKERNFNQEEILKALKKQDLDEVISLYQYHLFQQEKDVKMMVENLKKNMQKDIENEKLIYTPQELDMNDILVDVHYYNSMEQEYLNFLENKQQFIDFESERLNQNQNQKKQHTKQHEKIVMEDMACQICNDGDYTDDDLIVFCSKCNISVHQRCYGIPKIPNDDWICELCLSFGPEGKYLRCALCTKRGGAMKPSKIPITSNIFQHTNTQYYEFQKTCKAGPPNKKQRYEDPNEKQNKVGSASKHSTPENEEAEEESNSQYYDFHYLKEFTEEELKNEPKPYFVWCHITCTLWTPECFFDDKNYYTNIKGIENIDKQRFKLECSICKQKKAGSCVQCAKTKCMEAFHPECARRENIYMEIRNTDKLAYLIYCERHTPLKLRRLLEQKEKKYKEEIIKFCRSIERSREFRKKERNTKKERDRQLEKEQKKTPAKKKILISAKKIRQQITKNEEETNKEEQEFQQMLIHKMIEYIDSLTEEDLNRINSEFNSKKQNEEGQNSHVTQKQIDKEDKKLNASDPKSVKKINLWKNKVFIRKEEPFWKDIQYKSLSTLQIYKRYKRIQRDKNKKNEFKQLYLKTISAVKNIRIITKEERLKEKEQKKIEKQQKKQQKIAEIFIKTQERQKKKLEIQERKEQKEVQKKLKTQTDFELAKSAIRRTNKKRDKHNDKKQQKNLKQQELIIEQIVPHNYEPVDETSEQVYCVCRRKYQEGDQMMECEKCQEWYHFECIGFKGTIDEADQLNFMCKFCDLKDTENERQKRRQIYKDFFINIDAPNYDEFKDASNKQQQQVQQQEIQLEPKEDEVESSRKKSDSKSSKKQQKKQTQNKKRSSSTKLQDLEEQTTTSKKTKKSKDSKANSASSSKISEVKAKLDYTNYSDAKEEIFEEDEDDNEQKEEIQHQEEEEDGMHLEDIARQEDQENNKNDLISKQLDRDQQQLEENQNEQMKSKESQDIQKSDELMQNNDAIEQQQELQVQTSIEDTEAQALDSQDMSNKKAQIDLQVAKSIDQSIQKIDEEVSEIKNDEIKAEKQEENQNIKTEDIKTEKQEDIKTEENEKINKEKQDEEDEQNEINLLQEYQFHKKSDSLKIESQQSNNSQNQLNTNSLSKQNSNQNQQNVCNISNIESFKFKQKSIKDFFKKK
ncbi:hypothetical protein ABPG74_010733 [Tetrahymena malaccensis]